MVSTSSRASVTVAMLEVHAPLITMIAVLLLVITAVADPDLQIRGWGAVSKKKVRPFEPHFGLKIRWGAAPPPPPEAALDPPLRGTQLQTHIKFLLHSAMYL